MGLNHPFGHDKPSDRFLHRPAATVRLIHIHLHAVLGAFLRVHLLHRLVHFLEFELLDATHFTLHGGVVMQPHVMQEVRNSDGEVIDEGRALTWRQPLSPENAVVMRDAMVNVVERGTATRMQIPGISVAGKTGTAQLGTDPPRSHAWVIGFAPADAPRVAIAVIVLGQEGASEQTGGRVAAPIAKAVMETILAAPDRLTSGR